MVSLGAMFTKLLVLTLLVFTSAEDETCSTVQPVDLEEELPENLFLIQVTAHFNLSSFFSKERAQDVWSTLAEDANKVVQMVGIKPKGDKQGSQVYQEQLGLKTNSWQDVETLRTSLIFNVALILTYIGAFALLQHFQPIVYLSNSQQGRAPPARESYYGCRLSLDQIQDYAGLDGALLVEFCHLGMRITVCLGIPLAIVCLPAYFWLGKHPSEHSDQWCDKTVHHTPRSSLDLYSIASLRCNRPMRWVLAFFVWLVVFAVQRLLWDAQKRFVQMRIAWLQQRPKPQSSTILVSNIPPRYRSDKKLKDYFQKLFPDGTIERVYIVKHLENLMYLFRDFDEAEQKLHEAHYEWLQHDQDPEKRPRLTLTTEGEPVDSIEHFTRLVEHLTRLIEQERTQIHNADVFTQESLCGASGFVTFKASRDAEMALRLRLEPEGHLFTMQYAPAPRDVAYGDLLTTPWSRQVSHMVGYLLIFTVFILFFPLIGLASSIVNLENLENVSFIKQIMTNSSFLQAFFEGIFATLLITLFMGILPTTLSFIIDKTFTFSSSAESQLYLQEWYFWFQVIFVLLVTAIGTSLWQRFNDILSSPKGLLFDLAGNLPNTSTFYMDYVILQWSVSVLNVLRYQNLVKFLAWNTICDEDRAKQKSEPEDPDYYGVGSRSARLSLVLSIGLVFCLLSPLVLFFVFMFFLINKLVFSYLLVFAEVPKPDLGGKFWALQLRHVHLVLPIFVLVMSGCIWMEPYGGPGLLSLLSLSLWGYEYARWSDILWETLPFRAVVEGAESSHPSDEVYVQEELTRELRTTLPPAIKAS